MDTMDLLDSVRMITIYNQQPIIHHHYPQKKSGGVWKVWGVRSGQTYTEGALILHLQSSTFMIHYLPFTIYDQQPAIHHHQHSTKLNPNRRMITGSLAASYFSVYARIA